MVTPSAPAGGGTAVPGATVLALAGICKHFGFKPVFEKIEISISAGQCLMVKGPNGSGKTTLLRIIAGLLRPTSGQVALEHNQKKIINPELRNYLALVAPDLQLYTELTALENLEFLTRLRGFRYSRSELVEGLAYFGLSGRGGDLVKAYSTGMKQRLKYVYATLLKPVLLLLDEPYTNLDEAGKKLVAETIEIQRKKGIVVLATNEPEEAQYADQTIHLPRL